MSSLPPQSDLGRLIDDSMAEEAEMPRSEKPFVSPNTIWIAWGFMVGIVGQSFIQPSVELQLCCAGALGISMVWGWGIYCRRQHESEARVVDEAALRMEDRIDRHIPNSASMHPHLPGAKREMAGPQYLSGHLQRDAQYTERT